MIHQPMAYSVLPAFVQLSKEGSCAEFPLYVSEVAWAY
jgi:hypothetical protein